MLPNRRVGLIILTMLVGMTVEAQAQPAPTDWPQWRGPGRDGAVASFIEPAAWPELSGWRRR